MAEHVTRIEHSIFVQDGTPSDMSPNAFSRDLQTVDLDLTGSSYISNWEKPCKKKQKKLNKTCEEKSEEEPAATKLKLRQHKSHRKPEICDLWESPDKDGQWDYPQIEKFIGGACPMSYGRAETSQLAPKEDCRLPCQKKSQVKPPKKKTCSERSRDSSVSRDVCSKNPSRDGSLSRKSATRNDILSCEVRPRCESRDSSLSREVCPEEKATREKL